MSKEGASPFQHMHEESFSVPLPALKKERLPRLERKEEGVSVLRGHDRQSYAERVESAQGLEAREAFETVCRFAEAIKRARGRALLVGGSVRDEILGTASKDFDIEVYGLPSETIQKILATFGRVDEVGKAFGILKMSSGGIDLDVSMPRTDSKTGQGHTGFEVTLDPGMTIREAAKRRDFTFNALAKDPLTGDIFDPFGGAEDLGRRVLRVTDKERFRDDPLRVMRGAQFVGRFGLRIDPDSLQLMQEMVPQLRELPKERMKEEWEKLLMKSVLPSAALQALHEIGVIDALYPELADLRGTQQEFEWHPEGDVWVHTLMVVDAAKRIAERFRLEKDQARAVVYASLCHDLGKPGTTAYENGRVRSHAHDVAGDEPTRAFLEKLGVEKKFIERVVPLVREHLWPGVMLRQDEKAKNGNGEPVSDGAFRRLAKRLAPATIEDLTYVSEADHDGRGPFMDPDHPEQFLLQWGSKAGEWARDRATRIGVYQEAPKPIVTGRELLARGYKSGKLIGQIMAACDRLRDEKQLSREQILEGLADAPDAKSALETLEAALAR